MKALSLNRRRRNLHRDRSSADCLSVFFFDMSACLPSYNASSRSTENLYLISQSSVLRPPANLRIVASSPRSGCYAHASLHHSMDRPTDRRTRNMQDLLWACPYVGISDIISASRDGGRQV